MGRMKEVWMMIHDRLYSQAIDDGMTDEEAEEYADKYVDEEAQDYLDEMADQAYEQYKDRYYGL